MKGIIFGIVILIILGMMFTGQSMYQSNLESENPRSVKNFTVFLEEALVYNHNDSINSFEQNLSDLPNLDMTILKTGRINKILNSFMNFGIITTLESSKFLIEYGYIHPEYDFEFYMEMIKYILLILIILALIPVVIPLIAIIYLIFIGIKNVILGIIKFFNNISKKEIENG